MPWNPSNLPSFGAPPDPFKETYTTPERPGYLQGPYTVPTWSGDFTAEMGGPFTPPTMAELEASPGYQSRLNAGLLARQRSAAAQGSILSGGTQQALERYGQDYGANEYANLFNQKLTTRNQAFAEYQQRYGQFNDMAGRDLSARGLNENAYQTDVSNALNQYNARYQKYLDAYTNKRNAETDFWNRNFALSGNGLTAAGLARP